MGHMLLHLYDRLFSHTVLTLLTTYTFSFLRRSELLSPFLSHAFTFGFVALYLTRVLFHFDQERRIRAKGKHAPVVRTYTPFNIGVLFQALWYVSQDRYHDYWSTMFRTAGTKSNRYTAESTAIGERIIFTADEENIKAILATQFADYGKGPHFREEWKDFLGLSIFTTDGEMWHDSRQLLRPQFIKDRLSDLKTFEHHVQKLLPMLANNGETVRVDDLIYRYTLDAATAFLFGTGVGSLDNGEAEFAKAFAEVQR